MSAEQTPDIETAVWNVCDQIIADHPMWIGDDGRPLNYLPEREARIADFVRELADTSAQALAPVLAAAVREAAPSARRIYESIDWDFVEVFRGEDEPGYPTPEAFCEHLANALAGGRP